MSYEFDPEQLDRYQQYVGSLKRTLQIGGAAIHPMELGSMQLTLAEIGNILDQDITATEQYLGLTSVDPAVKVG